MSVGEILKILFVGFRPPPEMIDPNYPEFIQTIGGLKLTLALTLLSMILGMLLGLVLVLMRRDRGGMPRNLSPLHKALLRVLSAVSFLATETIRGIPIMLLVLLVYYLPYPLFGIRVPGAILAVFAFTLYTGVYLGEIFRSGFRAVPEGIVDAACVLGLSRPRILINIKLPIALRTMLPAILGLAITVFKDTSVLMIVGVADMTYTARQIQVAEPVNYLLVLFLLICIYWGIATVSSALVSQLEHRIISVKQDFSKLEGRI